MHKRPIDYSIPEDEGGHVDKKQRLTEDFFRKEITKIHVDTIMKLCKENDGYYYNIYDSLYGDMLNYMNNKLQYVINNDNKIKFLNFLHFKKGTITIYNNELDRVVYIILFIISNKNNVYNINLMRWFKLDEYNRNLLVKNDNNSNLIYANNIHTEDLVTLNLIKKKEEEEPKEEVIEKSNESLINTLTINTCSANEIFGLEELSLIAMINPSNQYLRFFGEVMLLKMFHKIDIKTAIIKYPNLKKILRIDHNKQRLISIFTVLLNDIDNDIIVNESINNKLSYEVKSILQQQTIVNTIFDINNIRFPQLVTWLEFEEYVCELEVHKYIDNIDVIKSMIKDIKHKIELIKIRLNSNNTFSEFIDPIYNAIKSLFVLKFKGLPMVKMDYKLMIYIINYFNKSLFSLKTLLNPESTTENGWKGVLDKGFIYLTLDTFLIKVIPKLQKLISYSDFVLYFFSHINRRNKEKSYNEMMQKLNTFCFPPYYKKRFFGNNNNYNNKHIHIFLSLFIIGDVKTTDSKTITYSSPTLGNRIDIEDIEDLIKTKLPPCINYARSKKHLENQSRLTLAVQYTNLGLEWNDIEKIHKDNNKESLNELKKQYNYQKKTVAKSYSCHAIFNTQGLQGFKCPYELEYKEEKKKKGDIKYDQVEKEEILSRCRKCNNTKHNTPSEYILNKLTIV